MTVVEPTEPGEPNGPPTAGPEPTPAPAATAEAAAGAPASLGTVFRRPGYRTVWSTNLLSAMTNGSSRFVFVWLVKDLTDWDAAAALLGIAVGLPALFLSVPAGSLADRLAPKRFGVPVLAAGAVAFAVMAAAVGSGRVSVAGAIALAFLTAVPLALIMPVLQSIVPAIVPRDELLQAVALQNMGLMLGIIAGAFVGGGIILVAGTAGALAFLGAVIAVGAVLFARGDLPGAPPPSMPGTAVPMSRVARDALTTEPLRTLLFLTVVLGFTMTANIILLPVVARDVLGANALEAGLINAVMGIGMMITSVLLARRGALRRPGRVMLTIQSVGLGTGLFLLGWSEVYGLTLLVAFSWGACGGIVMALLRMLTQVNTAPERMGRVMGLATLAQFGAFPLGALALFGLVEATGPREAMMIVGALVCVAIWSQWLRPGLRDG